MGDHPLDPAGGPGGSHRPEGDRNPLLYLSAGRRGRTDHPACGRAFANGCRRTPKSSAPTRPSSRTIANDQAVLDLYNEKAGILDRTPTRKSTSPRTPTRSGRTCHRGRPIACEDHPRSAPSSFATKGLSSQPREDRTAFCSTCAPLPATMRWPGSTKAAQSVTESQFAILQGCRMHAGNACLAAPGRPSRARPQGIEQIIEEEKTVGGQLGRPSGARFRNLRTAQAVCGRGQGDAVRISGATEGHRRNLSISAAPHGGRYAEPAASRGIDDEDLAGLVIGLRDEDRLCVIQEDDTSRGSRRLFARWD